MSMRGELRFTYILTDNRSHAIKLWRGCIIDCLDDQQRRVHKRRKADNDRRRLSVLYITVFTSAQQIALYMEEIDQLAV